MKINMDSHSNDLYRWKRVSQPRTYSRSQRITTSDDVQGWIKKVEDASDVAAAATFGVHYGAGRSAGKAKALATREQLHEHDAAYAEAQDLLNQWVSEKLTLADDEEEFDNEPWAKTASTSRSGSSSKKTEWENLLDDLDDSGEIDLTAKLHHKLDTADLYGELDVEDEDVAVDRILQNMMDKDLVQEEFFQDLGLDDTKKQKDPRTKMQVRQQQVKENREKRTKELERKRREQQSKKDTVFKAKQLVLKEEKAKALKSKKEEEKVQQEMARIRKEMQEERKKKDEQAARERHAREERERELREEAMHINEVDDQRHLQEKMATAQRREHVMKKMEQFQHKRVADNLKILQRHFTAWYNIVIERRLQLGKARAMQDWRLLLRAWNAWKAYVRAKRIKVEAAQAEMDIRDYHRKSQIAQEHHRKTLVRRYLLVWQAWSQQNQGKRELELAQNKTRSKMEALLQAAATGQLWSARSGKSDTPSEWSARSGGKGDAHSEEQLMLEDVDGRVDELFAQPGRKPAARGMDSARSSLSTSRSDTSSNRHWKPPPLEKPREAWQVTRRHAKLSKDDLAAMEPSKQNKQPNSARSASDKKVWDKAPWTPDRYEHRQAAQQKILAEQQKMIKEQTKLIQEMKHQQQMQMLQQQLLQQQQLTQLVDSPELIEKLQQLNNAPTATCATPGSTPRDTHGQLDNLQHNDVSKNINQDSARTAGGKSEGNSTGRSGTERSGTQSLDSARSEKSNVTTTTAMSSVSSRHTEFTQRMEERAATRAKLKQEREEKKRKAETEKLAELEAIEQEHLRKIDEEKAAQREALREKRRLEKQREEEKQARLEQMRQLHTKAEEHHRRSLIRRYAWSPWRKLIHNLHSNNQVAQDHYQLQLQRKCLLAWQDVISEDVAEKKRLADEMFNFIIVKRCLSNWMKIGQYVSIQEERASRYYKENLVARFFRAWSDYTMDEKEAMWAKDRMARQHNTRRLQKTYLLAWRRFPRMLKAERAKEERMAEMRRKVSSLLPDYEGMARSNVSP